ISGEPFDAVGLEGQLVHDPAIDMALDVRARTQILDGVLDNFGTGVALEREARRRIVIRLWQRLSGFDFLQDIADTRIGSMLALIKLAQPFNMNGSSICRTASGDEARTQRYFAAGGD